jgi:ATP-dependent protease Clp, ATPase subunit
LLDTMYEVPSDPSVKEVIISDKVISKGEQPIIVYESSAQNSH